MFFWLWKSHVIKQGPNRRPILQSTKLLARDASFPPKSKKTQWFSLLFQPLSCQPRLACLAGLICLTKCRDSCWRGYFCECGRSRAGPKWVPMQIGWAGLTRPKTDTDPDRDLKARPVNNSPPGDR